MLLYAGSAAFTEGRGAGGVPPWQLFVTPKLELAQL